MEESPSEQELVDAFRKCGIKKAVITLGSKGALIVDEDGYDTVPVFSFGQAVDTTGAGDTFNGTLTASLSLGKTMREAVRLAAIAAGISVTRRGAAGSIPNRMEVMDCYENHKS